MYEIKVANGNDVFYITEEEKLRVLRRRMELERKANRKRFFTKETITQKIMAVVLAIGSFAGAVYTQDAGILLVGLCVSLVLFFIKEKLF